MSRIAIWRRKNHPERKDTLSVSGLGSVVWTTNGSKFTGVNSSLSTVVMYFISIRLDVFTIEEDNLNLTFFVQNSNFKLMKNARYARTVTNYTVNTGSRVGGNSLFHVALQVRLLISVQLSLTELSGKEQCNIYNLFFCRYD